MTTIASVVAHSGNKKLKVTVQNLREGEWVTESEQELDPRKFDKRDTNMYDGRRVIVEEVGEFIT